MRRIVLIPLALGILAVSASAASAIAPTWNSGYNGWWPSGFGYPPVTVAAHAYPCSVTAYGATFNYHGSSWNQDYGAGTSCADGVGLKTLRVSDQVLGASGHTWYTISGSTFTAGPSSANPVRMIRNRAAFLGHAYRTVATATLVVPNGYAGCSITNTCSETLTATARSRPLAP